MAYHMIGWLGRARGRAAASAGEGDALFRFVSIGYIRPYYSAHGDRAGRIDRHGEQGS